MVNLSQEISLNIINEIIKIVPYLDVDIQQQTKLKNKIEEQLNNYEITSRCTDLCKCDILEKAFMFLACKKLEGMKQSTGYNYTLLFKKMNTYINIPLSSITTMDLRMFLAKVYKDNQQNSVNDKINKIRSFFGWLQNEGYISKNPAYNLKPTKEPYRKRNPLSMEDVEKMREHCNTTRLKTLYEFLLSTGCRVSEVTNAEISKIDWQENSITVIGKGDKERRVYFSTRARLFLIKYINERQDKGIVSDSLFVASKYPYAKLGQRSIEKDIKLLALRAGVADNVFPHKLRTTFVTTGINMGVELPVMQKLCGHASPNTTQIYYTISDNNMKHEYRKIAL